MILCMAFPAYAENEGTVAVDPDVATGTAVFQFKEPEGWPGYNVVLELYNENVGDFYTVYCYRQNGYTARESLPVGQYSVDVAMAAGDSRCDYPLQASSDSFSLEAGRAVSIDVLYAGESLVEETASPSVPDQGNEETKQEDEVQQITVGQSLRDALLKMLKVNLLFVIPAGVIGGLYYFKVYKKNKDLTNE